MTDSTFYKTLDHDPTHEFVKTATDVICEMRNGDHISEKDAVYLTLDRSKVGRFYFLSKIHKAANLGRHIVSANGYRTEKKYQNLLTCIFILMYRTYYPTCRILQTFRESKVQWVLFYLKLFLFRCHIKVVSKHVKRFGKHCLLKNPDTNPD